MPVTNRVLWACLAAGLCGRGVVLAIADSPIQFFAVLIAAWGLVPYGLLVGVSDSLRPRVRLATQMLVVFCDFSALAQAAWGSASTSAVALALEPAFVAFVVVPMALLLGRR